jgi:16S rRNA (guanine(1405)-N(7))-methyltransferase
LGGIGPIRRVLDLGCGLNPLALPWMGLPAETAYFACDVDREQVAFLDWWLAFSARRGQAFVWNLLDGAPPVTDDAPYDVALLLKIVPCLAQLDRQIGARLLESVTARVLIVSFPAQSLGGRRKGMVATYTAEMEALIAGRGWAVERFEFPSELVFRLLPMPGRPLASR